MCELFSLCKTPIPMSVLLSDKYYIKYYRIYNHIVNIPCASTLAHATPTATWVVIWVTSPNKLFAAFKVSVMILCSYEPVILFNSVSCNMLNVICESLALVSPHPSYLLTVSSENRCYITRSAYVSYLRIIWSRMPLMHIPDALTFYGSRHW